MGKHVRELLRIALLRIRRKVLKTSTTRKHLALSLIALSALSICGCAKAIDKKDVFASGVKYYNERNYVQAEKKFEESLKLFSAEKATSPDVCSIEMYLANTRCELGKFKEAIDMHKQTIESMSKQYGADSEQVADAELRLGIDHYSSNDKKAAKAHYDNSLRILKKHLPKTAVKVKQLQSKLKALADNK